MADTSHGPPTGAPEGILARLMAEYWLWLGLSQPGVYGDWSRLERTARARVALGVDAPVCMRAAQVAR